MLSPRLKKTTHVVEPKQQGILKALYFDAETNWLRPDVCLIDPDGEVLWQTNALALRGPDVEQGARLGIVWGDSAIFGVHERGWPEMINDFSQDCTFLNGGIEGVNYLTVLRRALEFNRHNDVAINVVFTGWHDLGANRNLEADLEKALDEIPNAILGTMPTSLNARILDSDIGRAIHPGSKVDPCGDMYGFWGSHPYSVQLQKKLYAHITQRNAIVRTVAERTRTPLIDLFAALDSSQLEDFRTYFFDVPHPRPSAYQRIASTVWNSIAPLLEKDPVSQLRA